MAYIVTTHELLIITILLGKSYVAEQFLQAFFSYKVFISPFNFCSTYYLPNQTPFA